MAEIISIEESASPKEKTPVGWHKFWDKEIRASQKRLTRYQKQGNKIVDRYIDTRGEGENSTRLNLFHTNIRTLCSMLYGSKPKIEVSREHQDPDDDIARVASTLYQRILEAETDPSGETLSAVLKSALLDRLLPGMGIGRVRYELETAMIPDTLSGEDVETFISESAPVDYVHWQDFLWGWCRTWSEMPWQGFRVWMDKEEAIKRFGKTKADALSYKNQLPTGDEATSTIIESDKESSVRKAEIWEIWSKKEKKVFWYHEGADLILDIKEDPLKLDGFWPIPQPLIANPTTTLYEPTADYHMAQDLYNQIDTLATRIHIITKAIKVVGVYNSKEIGIKRMLEEGLENQLIPVDNWAMFGDSGGLRGNVEWFPVEQVAETLATLRQILSDTMSMLYEVTGMSDLLRGGSTDQYTSDGTNQLKAKFGSITVQALQDEFARFASDLEALRAEIISKHFKTETIVQQSGAMFLPTFDHDKIGPALQLMQSKEIKWRINIRPESVAMVDYAQLQNERTAFLTAMATFLQSGQAVMKQVPSAGPMLMEMLKWAMAGFKGSNYLEGMMDAAIEEAKKNPPKPEGEGDGAKEMQLEQMRAQIKQQENQQKFEQDMQREQVRSQNAIKMEMLDQQNKMTMEATSHENNMRESLTDFKQDMIKLMEGIKNDLKREEAQSTMAILEEQVEHKNTMTEKQFDDASKVKLEKMKPKPKGGDD